nr:hypothetical protein [Halobacterium sp. R2-5]
MHANSGCSAKCRTSMWRRDPVTPAAERSSAPNVSGSRSNSRRTSAKLSKTVELPDESALRRSTT